ncbi:NAD(P)/FAD-dependent oxidoreductase [Rhodoplanes sp. TEM]|uniref:Pyridine nucleotide-disulfide oxidoreductase domain-containing protein 2 n=1 Tax=Rhodoplanes tepidamans TaxID=200616 RepID=A0ABT5JID9_RHOTP|nr:MULTISPECIES: NAD(P)/FAD-dependent oxidoreductase [Rhodoplanes]MDC7789495.1 NAD(P)/FAD-dependent oxidoreductase [Rhodoplanes tepidamans]MDC7986125.1 NAD(P)/FAD-dependent oxidoreductase [Rhodoplanes sp. TEM]MDQ0358912.1 phytoene dehydrogenase-like protein [Rhodoplanes tepidamans]
MPASSGGPVGDPPDDVLIVGGGHNGLVCAAYLARAGLRVRVLERRGVLGGATVTEEFHPGFRNSTAAYTLSLLAPKVIRDLDLHGRGLRIVERRAQNFLPTLDGRSLLTGEGRTVAEIARFSPRDAERYSGYAAELGVVAGVLRDLALQAPPNLVPAFDRRAPGELLRLLRLAATLRRLDLAQARAFYDLFTRSAADHLDGWFDSEPVKALFGFDAVVGTYASPATPGTAYVLLHHAFGEVNGKPGQWGHAIGGMGAVADAIAAAARAHGAVLETDADVAEILVEQDRVAGAVLRGGRVHRARAVAAAIEPKRFYAMVPQEALPPAFARRLRGWTCGSGTFRMNVALSRLPSFTALPGHDLQDHHTAGIVLAPSLAYMDRAYLDARRFGWSREPIVEMLIPSTLDPTLAPEGAHVASLFCQHVAPALPDGMVWAEHREAVADLMIDTVERFAPGFRASVIARTALGPQDLDSVFGLTGGDIFHGAMTLDQIGPARPMLGHADYRGPIAGLYHCGAGAHPGGGVTGAPGHNAAQAILRDLRRRGRR